jgi:hypothetical protein
VPENESWGPTELCFVTGKEINIHQKGMSAAGFLPTFPTPPDGGFSEMNLMKEQA